LTSNEINEKKGKSFALKSKLHLFGQKFFPKSAKQSTLFTILMVFVLALELHGQCTSDISLKVRPMRRLVYLLILVLVVGVSATGVGASTDCERWFAEYHSQLVHSQQVQRLAAAKRRAKLYAQRKLAGYVKPAHKPNPNLVPVHHVPRMNRHDAMHRVDLACGVLPENSPDQTLLAEEQPGEFTSDLPLANDEVGLLPGFDGPGSLLPEEGPKPPIFSEAPPIFSGGGPPIYTVPFTTPVTGGGTLPGGNAGGPGSPGSPGSPGGPVTPVPEPGSFVFLLTGMGGVAGLVRRRLLA
jgi:hypothetical protein